MPEGFHRATEWTGLDTDGDAAVTLLDIDAPMDAAAAGMSKEMLQAAGITLLQSEAGEAGGQRKVTVKATQEIEGITFEKWLVAIGDDKSTMVICAYPIEQSDAYEAICRKIVESVRPLKGGATPREEAGLVGDVVGFSLAEPKLLKLTRLLNLTQIFTSDGKLPVKSPADPLLVAARLSQGTKMGDVAAYAEERLRQTAETEILSTETIETGTADPNWRTCEIVATARDKKSGHPLVVYQKLFVAPDASYLVQGLVGAERREEMLPEFRRMAEGFRRLSDEEVKAATLEHYRRHRMGLPGDRLGGAGRERGGSPMGTAPRPSSAKNSMQELLEKANRGSSGRGRVRGKRPQESDEEFERYTAARLEAGRRRREEMRREMEERQALRRGSGRSEGDDESRGPFAIVDFEDDRPKEDREMRRPAWEREEQSGDSRERSQPARLGRPKKPLPVLKYDKTAVKTSPMLGGDGEELFDELAPEGGILVGARVVVGDSFGGSVQAIEPIFQVGGKYVRSTLHGQEGDDRQLLLAPPGHAVGGVQVGAGLLMDAMRLVYLPIDGNRLDTRDRMYSEWVGGDGGGTTECVSDGSFVVGLGGTYEREEMKSLRLAYVNREAVELAGVAEEKSNDKAVAKTEGDATTSEMRRWTSADGKFSITGRLENFDGKTATIVKGDGKRAKVPAEKLSPKDQGYLEAMTPK